MCIRDSSGPGLNDKNLAARRKALDLAPPSSMSRRDRRVYGSTSGSTVGNVPPPAYFEIHRVDSTHVKLNWEKVPGVTHYVVHNLTSGGSTGRRETEAILSGLEPGHEYAFSVASADRYGQSKPCKPQKVLMPDDVEGNTGVRKTLRRKLNQTSGELHDVAHKLRTEEGKVQQLERRLADKHKEYAEHLSEKDRVIAELRAQLKEHEGGHKGIVEQVTQAAEDLNMSSIGVE
eukprot:TRINITY_DN10452_c0_g1_i4.p1 TRINITY_DN10452_c0_g1~~TRINITY_DN10452_c0_g1_i4.p1  ORF type:complete len:232 (-),score=57.86 TRINITY_DN10452_c0_g1_i4:70-765(-)